MVKETGITMLSPAKIVSFTEPGVQVIVGLAGAGEGVNKIKARIRRTPDDITINPVKIRRRVLRIISMLLC